MARDPNIEAIYPLSPMQQGMLFHILAEGESGAYFRQSIWTLPGKLDGPALRKAWECVVERHAILRTAFVWKGLEEPLQVVRKVVSLSWEEMDWRYLASTNQESRLDSWLRDQRRRGFDLTRAPLLCLALIRIGDNSFLLVWSFAQLLLDGWSRELLLREVVTCYEAFKQGSEPHLGPVRPYRDYIAWVRRQDLVQAESYWRSTLAGFREPTPLPENGGSALSGQGGEIQSERKVELSLEASAALRSLARRHHVTLSTVVSGAWSLILARHADLTEVVLGAVVSGRPPDIPGIEEMVGLFINTLPLRVPVPPHSVLVPWLRSLQELQAGLREHEHTPLVQVQRWSEVPAGRPLFESTFVCQNYSGQSDSEEGTAEVKPTREIASFEQTNYPLGLTIIPGSRISLVIGFSLERFGAVEVGRLLEQLETLLETFPAASEVRLSELPILSAAERHQLMTEWNDTLEPRSSDLLVHEIFTLQARSRRDQLAVTCGADNLTYGELERRANQLAWHLRALGSGPEVPVCLCAERSPDLVVGLLGILKAGGAYLPLDPDLPRERLTFLLEDALRGFSAPVVVSHEAFADRLANILPPGARTVRIDTNQEEISRWQAEPPAGGATEESLAYLIFTSGSTGRPKAVGIAHRSLREVLLASQRRFAWSAGMRTLCLAPFSFDIFLFELLNSLLAGGICELIPLRPALDLQRLLARLADADVIHAVPALMRQMVSVVEQEGRAPFGGVRAVFTGGDTVPQDLLVDLPQMFPNARLRILYGPTESTIICSSHEVVSGIGDPQPLLGRPLPNVRIHLLDRSFQQVPIGAVGEIFIGGAGVARGYRALPSLTAERFLPDAFSGEVGGRLYRSGDLACRLPDGNLRFLGRADRQIKIRGFRVEPGEIETALRRHPEVAEAVALVDDDEAGERRLVAYLVPRSGDSPEAGELRRFLRETLSDYMIPSELVTLSALPLTAHGKVDIRALPSPERHRSGVRSSYAAPRTPLEEVMAAIWADVLGLERVGCDDNFFDLGGHSLIAMRLVSRLQQTLGREVPLREIFDAPTVAGLAARLEQVMLDRRREEAPPPLRRTSRDCDSPLSFAQQRLWFFEQLEPGSTLYNIPLALRLGGPLDPGVLAAAFGEVACRHEALRTRFAEREGAAVQEIMPPSPVVPLIIDLSGLGEEEQSATAVRLAAREVQHPFDLTRGPLWRAALIRQASDEHVVLLVMHHAISDAWSVEVLAQEMAALYGAFAEWQPSHLPELPIQYADYACWQREWLRGEVLDSIVAWWKERLEGAPELLPLPTDRPRPAMPGPHGAVRSLRLPDDLPQKLRSLGRRQGVTPFMTALAGLDALLAVYTGYEDLTVGTPIAGRGRIELEGLIGLFVNTLVLRTDLSGHPSFRDVVGRVRETVLGAFMHQDLPFEKLVDELIPERGLSHTPLFQVMFALQAEPLAPPAMRGLRVEGYPVETTSAKFDLALTVLESSVGLDVVLSYRTELFDGITVARMLRHYAALLEAAVADAERPFVDLPMLAPEERQALIVEEESDRGEHCESRSIIGLLRHQAERNPHGLALVCEHTHLTYGALEHRSNQLARFLGDFGIMAEVRIGIFLDRSPDLIVAILAVLKAGGAYVPLDPDLPAERLRLLLTDAEARLVLTLERLESALPDVGATVLRLDAEAGEIARRPPEALATEPVPARAAYLIYTSGTTGTPKAVVVSHGNLAASLLSSARRFGWSREDRMLCLAPFSFDIFLFELLSPLLAGGTSVLVSMRPALDLERLLELLRECTALHAVPALMRQIVHAIRRRPAGGEGYRGLRAVFVGGDAVPRDLLDDIQEAFPRACLRVLYGPTESTIICSSYEVPQETEPIVAPLGRPFEGTRLLVSSPWWGPAPLGVAGEVWIGGAVSRGYLGRPALTAERFVPDPSGSEPGARLYRSGDLARRRPDGNLEFLGRTDQQVKIRGFRIEPGEVEAALLRIPGVRQAVAVARRAEAGEARLIAYIVAEGELTTVGELRDRLAGSLPDYMVPSVFVFLDDMPLTTHGKVDRRALPEPEAERPRLDRVYAEPRTETEKALTEIWRRLLRVDRVGIHDNFFELGGDSILCIQVVAQARKAGLHLTPKQVFQTPTIAALTRQVKLATTASQQERVSGEVPLTPIQHHFFSLPLKRPHHFNQALLLEIRRSVAPFLLRRALTEVVEHHDALRLRFRRDDEGWRQLHADETGPDWWLHVDLSALPDPRWREAVERTAQEIQISLDLARGPLLRTVWFAAGPGRPERLLWVIHHLAVDAVSWRILVEDLEDACDQLEEGSVVRLPSKTTSFKEWAERLAAHSRSGALAAEREHWSASRHWPAHLPTDFPRSTETRPRAGGMVPVSLDNEETRALLQEVPPIYRTQINDVLLTALALCLSRWSDGGSLRIELEGHGREELFEDVDLSRTVGWFTILYPVVLDVAPTMPIGEALKSIKEQLRKVPYKGIGYGLLRWLSEDPEDVALRHLPPPEVSLNYLGQLDQGIPESSRFTPAPESKGDTVPANMPATHLLRVDAAVLEGRLHVGWLYSELLSTATVQMLADNFVAILRRIIAHCREPEAGGYTPADFPLARLDSVRLERLLGSDRTIEDVYPLSPMQRGLLFQSLYAPESEAYFEQLNLELLGQLHPDAFRKACQRVLDRHPILRTSFVWEELEEPLQVVRRRVELPWEELDWRGEPAKGGTGRLEEHLATDRCRGFDPARVPLMRASLIRLDDQVWRLTWSNHHLLLDGWCLGLVFQEVLTFYEAFTEDRDVLLPESRPYRDYIAWLQRQDLSEAEAFWRRMLEGFTAPTSLGLRAAPEGSRGGASSCEVGELLDTEHTARLAELVRRHHLTLNTLVQGAWALLLSHYSGENDVLFGAVVSGRPPELVGVESMVGLFINTLPVRVQAAPGQRLLGWLEEIQRRQVELRQYEYSPLVQVQGWSDVPAGLPLFETLLVFENYPVGESVRASEGSLRIGEVRSVEQTHYPVNLLVGPGRELRLKLLFDPGRLDAMSARRVLGRLVFLLHEMSETPGARLEELSPLLEAERHQLLIEWSAGEPLALSAACLHELFAAQADRTPQRAALVHGGEVLTYRQLDAASDRLAEVLRAYGAAPEVRVGICLDRSPALAVGVLGVLKAGAAYVPLDPSYPRERLAWMLEDSGAEIVLTREGVLDETLGREVRRILMEASGRTVTKDAAAESCFSAARPCPDNLAYVIYTSGSTGRPKGVAIRHRSAVTLVRWAGSVFPPEDLAGVLASTSICFDLSIFELFVPWSWGGAVLLAESALDEQLSSGGGVEVTLVNTVPSAMAELLRLGVVPRSVRTINLAGEPLRSNLVAEAYCTGTVTRVLNLYGPSEDTTYSTCAVATPNAGREPTIGRPIANTWAYVLDRWLRPVPEGIAGELFLGGDGLARGYLRQPDLTAERFVPDPFGRWGERLYRTGDLARHLHDGELEFLGRLDHQVKVRGFRIELGEIEAALAAHPEVGGAAAAVCEDVPGDRQLVAYVSPREGDLPIPALRAWLGERLPAFMIPSQLCVLPALPLTPNGKIDRRALPSPESFRTAEPVVPAGPCTPTEEVVADLWSEVLGVKTIGIHENFFDLGGHSLLATRLVSRLRMVFAVELPLRSVFDHPTVAALAACLEELRHPGEALRTAAPLPSVPRDAYRVRRTGLTGGDAEGGMGDQVYAFPASYAQQRLWVIDQFDPGSAAYNILQGLRIEGDLDLGTLHQTLSELVRRHETLRTSFARLDGELVQVVDPDLRLPLNVADLSDLPPGAGEAELRRVARREAARSFDLSQSPLLRVLLVRLRAYEHVALFSIHHIVSDAWSMGVLVREVGALYDGFCRGLRSPLPEPRLQYADFAVWQRQWLQGAVLEENLKFWKCRLAGELPVLELAPGRRRAGEEGRGRREILFLPTELTQPVRGLSRREGATLFMTLLAAFQVLLRRCSGQDDFIVGIPIANRSRAETESLVGFFINMLALRSDLSGNPTFRQLLARVREETLGAFRYQDLPFDLLMQELDGRGSGASLLRITFGVQNAPVENLSLPGLRLSPVEFENDLVRHDLTLWMAETGEQLSAMWTYDTSLFDASSIRRIQKLLESILREVTRDPDVRLDDLELSYEEDRVAERSREQIKLQKLREVKPRVIQVRAPG
ncbi:MAG TPA: amino acid adenylation domain-containing protein [Thermoanaerobaculia bacterium]